MFTDKFVRSNLPCVHGREEIFMSNLNEFSVGIPIPLRSDTVKFSLNIREIIAYATALLGMIGDQISTRLGLTEPGNYELNAYASWLMERGLWLPFDLLVLTMVICAPAFFLRRCNLKIRWLTLSYPILFGIIRLTAAISNLIIIFFC